MKRTGITGSNVEKLTKLLPEYLLQSKSKGTSKMYSNLFDKWEQFITSRGGKSMPAKEILV